MARMPDDNGTCINVLDSSGIVTFVNATGLRLLEAEREDQLTGKPYVDLWPADHRRQIAEAIAAAVSGKIAVFEGFCPTFRGNPRYWEASFYAVKRADDHVDIIGISRDISAWRREALSARARAPYERAVILG